MIGQTQPDVDVNNMNQYGGAHRFVFQPNSHKRNLVLEGIPPIPDWEVIDYIVKLCFKEGVIAHLTDIFSPSIM